MDSDWWTNAGKTAGAVAGLLLGIPVWSQAAPLPDPPVRRESSYSPTTLLLCNGRLDESVELATYYAAARGIPARNILRLYLEPAEEVTRAVYETRIAAPLREMLLKRGWWMPERDAKTGQQMLRSHFHVLVLFRGMPLRIKPAREQEPVLESSASSVDSELAALGQPGSALAGPLRNPYFQSELPFARAGQPIQLVGRIDGPSREQCQRMIDGALQAEAEGLWGNAYVDLSQGADAAGECLQALASQLRGQGVPVTVNRFPLPFPPGYPMKDPAFYFGSKEDGLGGPLGELQPLFRPGAIAAHLTNTCAASVRDAKIAWAAALLQRGAAAVAGHVADPDPTLAIRLEILIDRLFKGHTLVESAGMASPALSWMGVILGDPLYRPFRRAGDGIDEEQYRKDEMLPYKVIRLAHGRWGEGQAVPDQELILKLEMASAKLPNPELIEHLGLLAAGSGNYRDARTHFMRARGQYSAPEDQLRMELHLADLAWSQNEKMKARKIWLDAAETFKASPASRAAAEYMKLFPMAQK